MGNMKFQNTLNLKSKDFNPEWLEGWTSLIKNKDFRDEMDNNPRINDKIIENIINTNGMILPKDEIIDPNVIEVYNLLQNDKDQFIDLCGLSLLGTQLRKLIEKEKLQVFLDVFGKEKLQTAIKTNVEYQPFADISIEDDRLLEFVRITGMRCILGWSLTLQPAAKSYIQLLLPKKLSSKEEISNSLEKNIAQDVITRVTKELNKFEIKHFLNAG